MASTAKNAPPPHSATETTPHNFVLANEKFWDTVGTQHVLAYPHVVSRARRAAEAIHKKVPFSPNMRVMDFACGIGLVSEHILPYVKSITGVDISQGMVNGFNAYFVDKGIPQEKSHAVKLELKGEEGELAGEKFDAIVCVSAFHLLPDIARTTEILVSFLKPGGVLAVVANASEPVSPPGGMEKYKDIIVQVWFGEEEVRGLFGRAGLGSITYGLVPSEEGDNELFCATGVKPE